MFYTWTLLKAFQKEFSISYQQWQVNPFSDAGAHLSAGLGVHGCFSHTSVLGFVSSFMELCCGLKRIK